MPKPIFTLDPDSELFRQEEIITRNLGDKKAVGEALWKIQAGKLYKTVFKSFAGYMAGQWQMCPSWAYQRIHYAKMCKLSTMVDTPPPQNERQARALGADGKLKHPTSTADADAKRNQKVGAYIRANFAMIAPGNRRDFLDHLMEVMQDLVGTMRSANSVSTSVNLPNEPNSGEIPAGIGDETPTKVTIQVNRPPLAGNQQPGPADAPKSPATSDTWRPDPRTGSVGACSIEEARRLGLIK